MSVYFDTYVYGVKYASLKACQPQRSGKDWDMLDGRNSCCFWNRLNIIIFWGSTMEVSVWPRMWSPPISDASLSIPTDVASQRMCATVVTCVPLPSLHLLRLHPDHPNPRPHHPGWRSLLGKCQNSTSAKPSMSRESYTNSYQQQRWYPKETWSFQKRKIQKSCWQWPITHIFRITWTKWRLFKIRGSEDLLSIVSGG